MVLVAAGGVSLILTNVQFGAFPQKSGKISIFYLEDTEPVKMGGLAKGLSIKI